MAQASTPSTPAGTTPRKKTTTRRPAAKRTTAARRSTASTAARAATTPTTPIGVVGEYAERAVLIQVGAALVARDVVVSSVNDVISTYSTPSKAQHQLKKFERRGTTARKGLERDVRKTRTRIERELRQRRRRLERTVNSFDASQLENAVQARLRDGSDLASRLQDRLVRRP